MEFRFDWSGQRIYVFYIAVCCILAGLDRLDGVCISGSEWWSFELLSIEFILVIPRKHRRCWGVLAHIISLCYTVRKWNALMVIPFHSTELFISLPHGAGSSHSASTLNPLEKLYKFSRICLGFWSGKVSTNL